jgi:hypothetical protein
MIFRARNDDSPICCTQHPIKGACAWSQQLLQAGSQVHFSSSKLSGGLHVGSNQVWLQRVEMVGVTVADGRGCVWTSVGGMGMTNAMHFRGCCQAIVQAVVGYSSHLFDIFAQNAGSRQLLYVAEQQPMAAGMTAYLALAQ